jgi:hypothetical protein
VGCFSYKHPSFTRVTSPNKKNTKNHHAGLNKAIEEREKQAKESNYLQATKKAAAVAETILCKCQTQALYTHIKQVFKPGTGGGLQQVDIPAVNPDGKAMKDGEGNEIREVLLEVDDIHKAIIECIRKHFHQAVDMPFGGSKEDSVLYDLVGYSGMSKAAKEIVEGTFLEKHRDLDIQPETEQLINELAMPVEIKALGNKIECEITQDNFCSGFKAWKESTSTSPSGCHLGHYKAIIKDPEMKKEEPTECNCDIDFVTTFTKAINIPL